DRRYAAVATLAPLSEVQQAARRSGALLGVAALVAMALLAWLGHRIARSITDPVLQLAGLAAAIAGGDRKTRVAETGSGEIDTLTKALNDMADSLQSSERELARNNRLAALGEMAARIAHEVRNPLTAIKLQLQLLQERVHGDNAGRIGGLLEEMRRLELIVDTTLESSRPAKLEASRTNLNRIVEDVTALMAPSFRHKGIRLDAELGSIEDTMLDPNRVKQLLLNLLTNAADALPKGGDILVSTHAHNEEICLVVEDSGAGFSTPPELELFSEPVDSSSGGLGVGLLLTRELAELHGGRIEAGTSKKLGGARLTVYFPIARCIDSG
ncbi:MAG: ATP-binding protein, partial [Pseudomonadota bacterium]